MRYGTIMSYSTSHLLPSAGRAPNREAASAPWICAPTMAAPLNLCLVRDVSFGIDLGTSEPVCVLTMAYSDAAGDSVRYQFVGADDVRAIRDLLKQELAEISPRPAWASDH